MGLMDRIKPTSANARAAIKMEASKAGLHDDELDEFADEFPTIEAAKAEIERRKAKPAMSAKDSLDVYNMVSSIGLPSKVAEDLIEEGVTMDTARERVIEAKAETGDKHEYTPRSRADIGKSWDSPEALVEKMADAEMARAHADHRPTMGAEFAGRRRPERMRAFCEMSGLRLPPGATDSQVYDAAMGRGRSVTMLGSLSTSDYSHVLEIAANKSLNMSFEAYTSALMGAGRERREVSDFRGIKNVQLSDGTELAKVNEDAEYTYSHLTEAGESYKLDTYGRIYRMTRQLIINDDTGALTESRRYGQGAAITVGRILVGLLEVNGGAGVTMGDGNPLFDVSHGNVASSGGVISVASVTEARTAMRRQKDLAGNEIMPRPRFLVVPPELETTAQQLLSVIEANKVADANPFTNTLDLIVEPMLSDPQRWYLAADPATADGIEYAYLDGAAGPQIFTREGWETDGMEFKVRMDFGAGFVEHRGWFTNPGA